MRGQPEVEGTQEVKEDGIPVVDIVFFRGGKKRGEVTQRRGGISGSVDLESRACMLYGV